MTVYSIFSADGHSSFKKYIYDCINISNSTVWYSLIIPAPATYDVMILTSYKYVL